MRRSRRPFKASFDHFSARATPSWRAGATRFLEALGPNGQLMVDLIPELKLIIGEQPPVPELPPQQAQSRFQLVFRRFIGVFARPEHPLVLFLDDLQWLDAATLDLLEDLFDPVGPAASDADRRLSGQRSRFRPSADAHARRHQGRRRNGRRRSRLRRSTGSISGSCLRTLFAASRSAPRRWRSWCIEKTGGNPFFAIQFMSSLAEEGLLTFDHDAARWSWDLDRIHAKRYTDNVVDLMVGKLTRLPAATQTALQQLACLGNIAEIAMLSIVLGISEEQLHADLWPAVRQELVEPQAGAYRFVHDRFQEAAYALIPEDERPAAHLRIGRLLAARTPPEAIEENVFEIVSQLNRGAALITAPAEREKLAELNLLAGRRAKAATAFAMALAHFTAGEAMLAEDRWERHYALSFALGIASGRMRVPDRRAGSGENAPCRAGRPCRHPARSGRRHPTCRWSQAIATSRLASTTCAASASRGRRNRRQRRSRQEYERMWRQIGERPIEALLDLPQMADPVACGTMDVLTVLVSPAWYIDENLAPPHHRAHGKSEPRSTATPMHRASLTLCSAPCLGPTLATTRRDIASPSSASTWSKGTDWTASRRASIWASVAGPGMSGRAVRCCGGPSTRRSRSATSTMPALPATIS